MIYSVKSNQCSLDRAQLNKPTRARCPRHPRRGAVTVLLVICLILLLGFVALAVDVGRGTLTSSQLQNAADAAAMAAAARLQDSYAEYANADPNKRHLLSNEAKQRAIAAGIEFGSKNIAAEVDSLKVLESDFEFGFTDATGKYVPGDGNFPNTVRVVLRRDAHANKELNFFFAPLLRMKSTALQADAQAIACVGEIQSFRGKDPQPPGDLGWCIEFWESSGEGWDCGVLPVALDVAVWEKFLQSGESPGGVTYTTADGLPEIQVYPTVTSAPGAFGLLNLGPPTNKTPAYRNWILNGPSPEDIQYLCDAGQLPIEEPETKRWPGTPGLHNSLGSTFAEIIGQPRLLPLFEPVSREPFQAVDGFGANATYRIVGFVGVEVSRSEANGSKLTIRVKPCDYIDSSAVLNPDTILPAGSEVAGNKKFTHAPVRFGK